MNRNIPNCLPLAVIVTVTVVTSAANACDRVVRRAPVRNHYSAVRSQPVTYAHSANYSYQPIAPTTVVKSTVVLSSALTTKKAPSLPEFSSGDHVKIRGENLGSKVGSAVVEISGVSIAAKVHRWSSDSAVVTLPELTVRDKQSATIRLRRSSGSVARSVNVALVGLSQRADKGIEKVSLESTERAALDLAAPASLAGSLDDETLAQLRKSGVVVDDSTIIVLDETR